MCMKNVNVNAIFADIVTSPEEGTVSLVNINRSFRIERDANGRKIPQLSLAVVLAATQEKEIDTQLLDSDKVFVFDQEYELVIRLTESVSGSFKDIGTFEVKPSEGDESKKICRHTFNYTHLGLYQDIYLPEESDSERFVIKINIRRKTKSEDKNEWIVQTISPIMFE